MAQVHRFHDAVAVSNDGETRYFTPREARKLAAAIYRAARSVESVRFADSDVGTHYATSVAHKDIGRVPVIPRGRIVARVYNRKRVAS